MDNQGNYLFRQNPDYIEAIWCVDSETSEECLVNLRTKEIIAKRVNGKLVDPSVKPEAPTC